MRIDNKTIDGRTNDLQVVGKIIELRIKSLKRGMTNLNWQTKQVLSVKNYRLSVNLDA